MYTILWGYRVKDEPVPRNPDDPVWQGLEKMRRDRLEARRKADETGEPYKDPYEDLLRRNFGLS